MLPVLIYEQNEDMRRQLLDAFDALAAEHMPAVKISISTGSMDSMHRALEAETGITLAVMGIGRGNCMDCARLGNEAMHMNRDNYTLYFVHNPGDIGVLLQNCMRPAGILIDPFDQQQLLDTLRRILSDYAELSGLDNDESCLTLEADTTAYRIPYSQILYLEALDKKINICTSRQCITVRKSLSSLADILPAQFLRCHRAYVVNTDFIGRVNFADMTLQLQNNDILPISRSQRTAMKQFLDGRAKV